MKRQSRVKGIAISYATTIIRTLTKLFLTPLYLRVLGLDDYGFYQYVYSIATYVTILDFGITSVINTFAIRYRESGDSDGVENVMFYTLIFSLISVLIIVAFGIVISVNATAVFGPTIAGKENLTRVLIAFMIGMLVMSMFQHYFDGVLLAAEKYITLRTVDLVLIFLRMIITLSLLYSNFGVVSIAVGDCLGIGMCLVFEWIYCVRVLDLKVKYHYKDMALFKAIAKLALALCLQSLISYLNASIDKYVLGRYVGTVAVTIYTLALTFSVFFEEIATAIQRLYLPQVVKLVSSGADGEALTSFVIVPGRYQLMLCGGVLGAFILFGRQFIEMWSGHETLQAWAIALYLMVPSVLPLIQNVCLSILTAMNKRMFRSYVLGAMAIANLFLTIYLVKKIGLMGAPIGTFISLILGNNIAMNLYYKKVIGINVVRLFGSILKGILPCAIVATCICIPLTLVNAKGVVWFAVECIAFCAVYGALLWLWGLNTTEKKQIKNAIPFLKARRSV